MDALNKSFSGLYENMSTILHANIDAMAESRVLRNASTMIQQTKTAIEESPLYQRSCKVLDQAWTFVKQHPTAFLTIAGLAGGALLAGGTFGASLLPLALPMTNATLPLFFGMLGANIATSGAIGALAGHGMDTIITGNRYDNEKYLSGFFKRNALAITMGTIGAMSAPFATTVGFIAARGAVESSAISFAGFITSIIASNALPGTLLGGLGGYMNAPSES